MRRTFFCESPYGTAIVTNGQGHPPTTMPYVLAEQHEGLVHGSWDAIHLLFDLECVAHVEV
jgi:hypothetical protein